MHRPGFVQTRERALDAFRTVLTEATTEGLRDLHEALQTLRFAIPEGKARLVRGTWGTLGAGEVRDEYSGCPLNALFIRQVRAGGGGLRDAIALSETLMRKHGYSAADFYGPWDKGLLSSTELRDIVEADLSARLNEQLTPPSAQRR